MVKVLVLVLVCYAAIQLAIEAHQERMQVVRSNSVAQKRPPESNGTPAMDLEGKDIHNKQKRKRTKHTSRNTQRTHPKRDLF